MVKGGCCSPVRLYLVPAPTGGSQLPITLALGTLMSPSQKHVHVPAHIYNKTNIKHILFEHTPQAGRPWFAREDTLEINDVLFPDF